MRKLVEIIIGINNIISIFLIKKFKLLLNSKGSKFDKSILICSPVQTLGDTVITSAFINTILKEFSGYRIDLIASEAIRDYYNHNSQLNNIYYVSKWINNWKVLFLRVPYAIYFYYKYFKKSNYKYIFLPRVDSDPLSIFISYIINHDRLIRFTSKSGHKNKIIIEKFFDQLSCNNIKNDDLSLHESVVQNKLLSSIGHVCNISKPSSWIIATELSTHSQQRNIVFAIGSSAKFRKMSDKRIVELIKYFFDSLNYEIKVIGGQSECDVLNVINNLFDGKVKTNSHKFYLKDIVIQSNESSIVIGYDSGLTHLLSLNAHAVIMLSPHPIDGKAYHSNSPTRFSPMHERCSVIQNESKCSKSCDEFCRSINSDCMDRINNHSILKVFNKLNLIK